MGKEVALLAEGVDRNAFAPCVVVVLAYVALLAEGVDRNIYTPGEKTGMVLSPSSRRAWIEITR